MTALSDWLSGRRRLAVLLIVVAVVLLAAVAVTAAQHSSTPPPRTGARPTVPGQSLRGAATSDPSSGSGGAPVVRESLSADEQSALDAMITRLRAMPAVAASTSPAHRPISGQAQMQPDLYAAALVRGLLTQDYRSPRAALLAWVQSQAGTSTEPTVVGLIPADLRPRLAAASVQEGFDGPGPVPAPGVWEALATQRGYTTAVIQRVIEPVPWSAAVAAGTITDPGATAREVDAKVMLHTTVGGRARTTVTSVAVTLNLEGPPSRTGYGLVSVVSYATKQGAQ